jgi:hypothetical protein
MLSSIAQVVYDSGIKEPIDLETIKACIKEDLTSDEVEETLDQLRSSIQAIQLTVDHVSTNSRFTGLCARLVIEDDLKDALFSGWEYHTGVLDFPVPDPRGINDPQDMYQGVINLYEGDYGALRLELAQYLIERVTALLELYGE